LISTDTYAEICYAPDSCRTVLYDDLGFGNNHDKRAEALRSNFQAFLDTRLELTSFPAEDPDKASDPDCENFFWGDQQGDKADAMNATYLIARPCIVEDVEWIGTEYFFVVRGANRCLP
jgi:hypothetical protein